MISLDSLKDVGDRVIPDSVQDWFGSNVTDPIKSRIDNLTNSVENDLKDTGEKVKADLGNAGKDIDEGLKGWDEDLQGAAAETGFRLQ